jgi:hypothetical protein
MPKAILWTIAILSFAAVVMVHELYAIQNTKTTSQALSKTDVESQTATDAAMETLLQEPPQKNREILSNTSINWDAAKKSTVKDIADVIFPENIGNNSISAPQEPATEPTSATVDTPVEDAPAITPSPDEATDTLQETPSQQTEDTISGQSSL